MKNHYTIDIKLMLKMGVSPIECMVLENIHFLSISEGWCFASKKKLATHHNITERGLFKIRARLVEQKLLKTNAKGHLKTTKKYSDFMSVDGYEQSSDYEQSSYEQSSDEPMNKVPTLPIKKELKEDSERTLEKIAEYIKDKNLSVDANKFFEYFEAGNWIDSKGNKVKNWKQKLLTWDNHSKQETKKPSQKGNKLWV